MIICCICGTEFVTSDTTMVYGCKSCKKGTARGQELTQKLKLFDPNEEPDKKVKKKRKR